MRRVVLVSFLIASVRIAAAQGADGSAAPAEPAEGGAPAKPDEAKKPAPPEESTEGTEADPSEAEPPPPDEAPEEKPAVTAVYDSGLKFESSDKKYEMKLLFRNQVRFETLRPLEDNSQFLSHFYIARSRFQAEGHVFGEENRYKGELGLSDSGSFSFVKDLYLEHQLAPGPVWLRAGQWKRPFFRQEMVSDFASEFNERSIADDLAGGGRDLGVALHNDYDKTAEGIEWVFGVFNGFGFPGAGGSDRPTLPITCATDAATGKVTCLGGKPTTFASDFGPTIVARAGWNSARAKGYSEADLEGGPLRYSVAAAYKVDLANFAKQGEKSLADNLSHGLELDWNIKVNGISISGGAVMMKVKSKDARYGFVLQPGLMIVPKHAEIAARFGFTTDKETAIDPTGMAVTSSRNNIEALGAFNYFVHGHHLKIATDFGILKKLGEAPVTMATDKPDIRVRVMGQLEI